MIDHAYSAGAVAVTWHGVWLVTAGLPLAGCCATAGQRCGKVAGMGWGWARGKEGNGGKRVGEGEKKTRDRLCSCEREKQKEREIGREGDNFMTNVGNATL